MASLRRGWLHTVRDRTNRSPTTTQMQGARSIGACRLSASHEVSIRGNGQATATFTSCGPGSNLPMRCGHSGHLSTAAPLVLGSGGGVRGERCRRSDMGEDVMAKKKIAI